MLPDFLTDESDVTVTWFYRRMLRITWMVPVNNEKLLRQTGIKKVGHRIRMLLLKQRQHIMKKPGLENLILTGLNGDKRKCTKQLVTGEIVNRQTLLRSTRDRMFWRDMIAHIPRKSRIYISVAKRCPCLASERLIFIVSALL